jgi:hypothetical protein
MRFARLSLLFVIGCGTTTDDKAPPLYTTFPDPTVVDTGFPPGDLANIHIRYDVNEGTTNVFALFAESAPNFLNLAKCAIEESTCIPTMPVDEANPVTFDPDDSIDAETIRTRYVGDVLGVGKYVLPYAEKPETKLGYYALDATKIGLVEGWVGASWAGQWPTYSSSEDLLVPEPIQIITPFAGGIINFTNDSMVPFEWVPTGEGDVTLTLIPTSGDAIIYRMEDDGYFELDTDQLALELAISDPVTEFTAFMSRWSRNTAIRFGHVVEYVASSDVQFTAKLIQIGTRDRAIPSDECAQAQGALPLVGGGYWGYLGLPRLDSNVDTDSTCLGFGNAYADSLGPDGMFRVQVEPRHFWTFDYNLLTESGSVYLVEDCNDVLGTCVDGADDSPDPNINEFVSYFNADDDTKTLYLVIDGTESGLESYFTLDAVDTLLAEPEMYDTCAEAEEHFLKPTVTEGTYWATFVAYTAGTNPGTGGCTGTSMGGSDAITPVEIPAGAVMTASVDMFGGDAGLYLLFNCNDAFSCPVGSDRSFDDRESVIYDNTASAYPVTVYVVVDSKTGIAPYFLTIDF